MSKMRSSIAIEIIKNHQMEILELKNTVREVKSAVESTGSGPDHAEKGMRKLKVMKLPEEEK